MTYFTSMLARWLLVGVGAIMLIAGKPVLAIVLVHLDASVPDSLIDDNGVITWLDQSGNSLNATDVGGATTSKRIDKRTARRDRELRCRWKGRLTVMHVDLCPSPAHEGHGSENHGCGDMSEHELSLVASADLVDGPPYHDARHGSSCVVDGLSLFWARVKRVFLVDRITSEDRWGRLTAASIRAPLEAIEKRLGVGSAQIETY